MRYLLPFLLCLLTTPAAAQQYQFRGDFVDTYLAEDGFLDRVPAGTVLNCSDRLCSGTRSVRIYVFRHGETVKKLWSTDYCDVMFDEPEKVRSCGDSGHIAYYDEANQLLYREQSCGPRSYSR